MSRKLLTLGLLFALAACGGGGGGSATSTLPGVPAGKPVNGQSAEVTLTFTVPARGGQTKHRSPQAIAPDTLSIDVSVNGGSVQTFNVTATGAGSGGCVTGVSTTCTETVLAPLGADTFAITTYSANGGSAGSGVKLDTGTFAYTVVANTANAPTFTLDAVVSTNASTNTPGSLLYALGNASSGDTIYLLASAGPSITVTSPITIAQNVTLAGPGAANLTITGAGTSQLFIISAGLLNVTIKDLTLAHGTAVGGGAIKNNSNLTLYHDTFSMNASTGGTAGGAIYNGMGASLIVTNSQFTSNSGPQGGAIYVHASSGTVSITGTTFTSNTATTNGGALLMYSPATLTNDVFQSNIAGDTSVSNGRGGAIFIAPGLTQTITGSAFTANQALSCNTCSNYGFGGAVYADTTTVLALASDTYGSSGVATSGNSAVGQYGGYGGAVYANGTLTITSGAYYYNSVSSSTTGSTSYGGAIWVNGNLNDSGGTVFDHNNAGGTLPVNSGGAGGAINANAGTIAGATFTNNSALGSGSGAGNGGAICSGAALQIGDSVIGTAGNGNTASTAGAGYYGMGSVSDQIYRTTIDSNTITGASPTSGAGIYLASGTSLSLSQDTISNNQLIGSASATGAGLMNNGTSSMQNTTFFGNSSSNLGGNIYNNGSLTLILSTVVQGMGASNSGNVYNVTSSGNIATNGTIFAYGNGSTTNAGINNNFIITSNDYNDILGAITGSFTPAAHDQTFDPNLSPTLAVNGTTYGPLTDAPVAPPAALDHTLTYGAGCTGSGGVTTDERGNFRSNSTSHAGYCTIGAFEDP